MRRVRRRARASARDGFTNSFVDCDGLAAGVGRRRRRAEADVALVVLGAWDVFDVEIDDAHVRVRHARVATSSSPPSSDRASTRWSAAGAKVALLEVPCMRPQDVEGAGVPALPERGDDARVAHLNELLRRLAGADPDNVTFVAGPDGVVRRRGDRDRSRLPLGRRPRLQAGREADLRDDRPGAARHPDVTANRSAPR